MNNFTISILTASLLLAVAPLPVNAETQTQTQEQTTQRAYGWQVMTEQERMEYQQQMRALSTEQERQQFREEHHKAMQERAKERGVTLPDEPIGPGPGGGGMGPGGGGMGPGGGGRWHGWWYGWSQPLISLRQHPLLHAHPENNAIP